MFSQTLVIQEQTFQVKFPNAGQILDIWNAQLLLSEGKYADMARQQTVLSNFMVDAIDAIATFTVLVPDLAKQLNARSFTDIDPKQLKLLVKAYRKQFAPWYSDILRQLLEEEEEVELDEDITETEDADTDPE